MTNRTYMHIDTRTNEVRPGPMPLGHGYTYHEAIRRLDDNELLHEGRWVIMSPAWQLDWNFFADEIERITGETVSR